MEKNFIKIRSAKDIVISSLLTIAGLVMVALPTATSVNLAGFFMIFTGILLFFLLKTAYKEETTGIKYCKKERYFSQTERLSLLEKIYSKPNEINIAEEDKGNAVRLDIFYSKQSGKAYLQVFEYIPYKYEPCSKQIEHELSSISKLV